MELHGMLLTIPHNSEAENRRTGWSLVLLFLLVCFVGLRGSSWPTLQWAGNEGVGILPFDWTGHWGIYHRYGFPGWGTDVDDGLTFLDGNFAHWPVRYAFGFRESPPQERKAPDVRSSLWYQRGDYFLDQFAFDLDFYTKREAVTRFEALKRNFEDQYGLLGPAGRPGGTVQQNYRITMNVPEDTSSGWLFSTAYYKTTDAIPTLSDLGAWEKGVSRVDRIMVNRLSHSRTDFQRKARFDFSTFSQRLKMNSLADDPDWDASLVTYKMRYGHENPLSSHSQRFYELSGKYSILDSDSLGNKRRFVFEGKAGFQQTSPEWENRFAVGGAFVSPDRRGLVVDVSLAYSPSNSSTIFIKANHSLHSLPFQFTGRRIVWYPTFPPKMYNSVRPDSKAISQQRTVLQMGTAYHSPRTQIQIEFFAARAAPHYYFENLKFVNSHYSYNLFLTEESSDHINGYFFKGEVNYFRDWFLEGSGTGFLNAKKGWGTGVQHEEQIVLTFRESLFKGRLNARLRLWADFWIGRDGYVWDPIISLGFYDRSNVEAHDFSPIVNFELRGTVSSFEISFTMMNLLYAGRSTVRNILGDGFSDEQLTLVPTPLFPPAGRLAYLTIHWQFMN